MVRSFREAFEMLFRFSKKRANITVEVANPAQKSSLERQSVYVPIDCRRREPRDAAVSASLLPVPGGNGPPSLIWKHCDPDYWGAVWDWSEGTWV